MSFVYYAQSDNLFSSVNFTTENSSSNSNICSSADNFDNDQICITPENSFFITFEKYSANFDFSSQLILPSFIVWQPPKTC